MIVRTLVSTVCLVLALAGSAAAVNISTIGDGDDDGFGGTQGTNSNDGDPFTPFASPTVAPGSHFLTSSFTDRTTVAPWTPYSFEFSFGYPDFDPSYIISVSVGIQMGGVARRADNSGYGFADVTMTDLATSETIVLGDILEVDTGSPASMAEDRVRMVTWDITAFMLARPFLNTLLTLNIDGSGLVNPGDQFALDYAVITTILADDSTTTTTTTTEPPTTTTAEPTTTTTTAESTTTTTLPAALCGPAPRTGCFAAAAGKSSVLLSSPADPTKRKLKWKWKGGDAFAADDVGNPVASSDPQYALCVYDASARPQPLVDASIPSGSCGVEPCWKAAGSGFKYKNKAGSPDGITKALFKPGEAGKSQVKIGGKGANLPLPTLDLTEPVVVQFVADNGTSVECWQTSFTDSTVNEAVTYKAKGP